MATAKKQTEDTGVATVPAIPTTPFVFKVADQEVNIELLTKRKNEYALIEIIDVNDKENYQLAVDARAELRTTRTSLEKLRKETSKPHQEFVKQLKEVSDKLGAICAEGEKILDDRIKFIDNEKQRIKDEKEAQKELERTKRITELVVLGFVFDGVATYSLPFDGSVIINTVQLKDFSEEEFGDFVFDARASKEKEDLRIANEKKAEAARLAEVNSKALQNDQKEIELIQRRTKLRCRELGMLGAVYNEDEQMHTMPNQGDMKISLDAVIDLDDDKWDELIYDLEHFTPVADEDLPKDNSFIIRPVNSIPGGFDDDDMDNAVNQTLQQLEPTLTDPNPTESPSSVGSEDEGFYSPEFVGWKFSKENPWEQSTMGSKFLLRVFPDCFKPQATWGLKEENIMAEGKLLNNQLNFIAFKL